MTFQRGLDGFLQLIGVWGFSLATCCNNEANQAISLGISQALSMFLALLVLPAWKWYILPMLYQLHSAHSAHGSCNGDASEEEPKTEAKRPRLLNRLGSEIGALSAEVKGPGLLNRLGSNRSISDDAKFIKRKLSDFGREGSVSLRVSLWHLFWWSLCDWTACTFAVLQFPLILWRLTRLTN